MKVFKVNVPEMRIRTVKVKAKDEYDAELNALLMKNVIHGSESYGEWEVDDIKDTEVFEEENEVNQKEIGNFKMDNDLNVNGTSYHDVNINVSPAFLFKFLGESGASDRYKVSKEWCFVYNGQPFTIYDWKETELYDDSLPSVRKFWKSNEIVSFHVGHFGEDKSDAMELAKLIEDEYKKSLK